MIVFANMTGVVSWKGESVRLGHDDPWDSEDPFVKDRPDLFHTTPSEVRHTSGHQPGVEQLPPTGTRRRVNRG